MFKKETSVTYRGDFLSFSLNVVTQVLFDAAHSDHRIIAQRLDNLKWRHEAILVDLLENSIKFIACFVQQFRARRKIGQGVNVEPRLLRAVFPQSFDCTLRVLGRRKRAEDI